MYDMDISGTGEQVSMVFENALVEGARKIMQKIMLMLVQDTTEASPYNTGFYNKVRRSNATSIDNIQGLLTIALTTVQTNIAATSLAEDPTIKELSGIAEPTNSASSVNIRIVMTLTDGTTTEDTLTITDNEGTS